MTFTNPHETRVLAAFLLIGNLGSCFYTAFHLTPSGPFIVLFYVGVFWALAAWVIADARRLSVAVPFDFGWFVFFAWPVVLPYHVFKTRGVRGFITLGALVGIYAATYLISLVLYFIVVSLRRS